MKDLPGIVYIVVAAALLALVWPILFPPPPSIAHLQAEHPTWSAHDLERVHEGYIWIGMTTEQTSESWGKPGRINKSVSAGGVREQWVYGSYTKYSSPTYLYFENGILTGWQD